MVGNATNKIYVPLDRVILMLLVPRPDPDNSVVLVIKDTLGMANLAKRSILVV